MNLRELVDHIRSGPAKLALDEPLRFRRRTRSNHPCDFHEFLQALQSSETIQKVVCWPLWRLGITEEEWVLLIKTLGRIRGIQDIDIICEPAASRDSRYFHAIAEAVNSAHSLRNLSIDMEYAILPRNPAGLIAFAHALRDHTALQEFSWFDVSPLPEAAQGVSPDFMLRTLPSCPHLRKVGRGRLLASSNHTTREEWVDALHELSILNVNDPSEFHVSCLYSLLRLNPATCMLAVDTTIESCE
jgi:hypothetical protein